MGNRVKLIQYSPERFFRFIHLHMLKRLHNEIPQDDWPLLQEVVLSQLTSPAITRDYK